MFVPHLKTRLDDQDGKTAMTKQTKLGFSTFRRRDVVTRGTARGQRDRDDQTDQAWFLNFQAS